MINDKVIYLATTKGCEACRIMEHILEQLEEYYNYNFNIKICDYAQLPIFIQNNVPLHDFPTIVFIKDGIIKYHCTGTMTAKSVIEILKDIDFI